MGLQYGIKEVYNLTVWDFATKKPYTYIDYAEATSNEVNGERLELRGGQGNGLQMTFDHTKTSTFNLTLPLVDLKLLALLSGEDLVTGAQSIYKREELTIASDTVTIANAAIANSDVVFELDGIRDNGTEFTRVGSAPTAGQYSISGTTLTFNASDNGKKIVVWYQYSTPTTATKISIKANKFPKTVMITGEGLWRDQETDTDKVVAFTLHKAKPQMNFTLTTSSSEATTLELPFDMLVHTVNGQQQYIDYVVLA